MCTRAERDRAPPRDRPKQARPTWLMRLAPLPPSPSPARALICPTAPGASTQVQRPPRHSQRTAPVPMAWLMRLASPPVPASALWGRKTDLWGVSRQEAHCFGQLSTHLIWPTLGWPQFATA